MNNKPLVSLIIPVYNVEAYLRECLDSVINQSYSNLEIIIVNDGSTDGSLSICEEYAAKDERIRVITQKNGGLSRARNTGLDSAKGLYIGFIDSDDKIHRKFVEAFIDVIEKTGCSIAVCDYCVEECKLNCIDDSYIEMVQSEAISGLLDDRGYKCFAWNKIYLRELFVDMEFPEGKIFEDIKLMYDIFNKVSSIAYIKQSMYFYRTRKGSITKRSFSKETYHLLESIDYVIANAESVPNIDYTRLMMGYLSYYIGFVRRGKIANADVSAESRKLNEYIRENRSSVISSKTIRTIKKAELLIFAYTPHIYSGLLKVVAVGK